DGVSGTNCGIQPGKNWTFEFQVKDQIGSFFYFPSLNFQKAAGGFGPIRVNNRIVIAVPFPQPEADFDLLMLKNGTTQSHQNMTMLMNGKGPYLNSSTQVYESFTVVEGNQRIQNHRMVVVETEGSYTDQMMVDSLDVHVGQSYSVLVTADQGVADYYIVASPKLVANEPANNGLVGIGVLRYEGSSTNASGTIPSGPDPFDLQLWNLTAGAARPNPQGSFNVSNVTIAQTFMLRGSKVNNVSYTTPDTPLKLADLYSNGSGVYTLDQFSTNSSNSNGNLQRGVFVATGEHRGWLELVLMNNLVGIDSWHLDGYGFFVVGYGFGDWTPTSRSSYNIYNPVVRSTVQWYLGEELYLRVYDSDPNPAKELPPPSNLLLCGNLF
ncbi:Monocopper oxidase-like protein SKU5, partial [Linum perenne]